ncbi:peptide chain release factor N(5)-glutamine methyltransferase [Parvularcula marina]|uniref:peptide chain release factor N(5)-glutamine methyltransferase n=1 Tax=Parvularcula marina TaxID=2292771 RepID=UPI0035137A30
MPLTYSQHLAEGTMRLGTSPTPVLDARVLLCAASGLDHAGLIAAAKDEVPMEAAGKYARMLSRRAGGEPVAYITGEQEFFGRTFKVTRDTLIPRPETEMLVEAAVAAAGPNPRVLDLGTGTGCLLLSVLGELTSAHGVGIDKSPGALQVAEKNAHLLKLDRWAEFRMLDFRYAPDGPFDIILSNPPYIEDDAALPVSVAGYEPELALRAGADGLDAYRVLAPVIAERLAPGGHAFLEIGTGQGEAVSSLMKAAMPEREVSVHNDLAGHERMVTVR